MPRVLMPWIVGAGLLFGGAGSALGDEPIELVPADSLLCWYGRAFPETQPPADTQPSALATLLDLGTRIVGRPLKRRDQLTVRILEALGLMVRYPYAVALLDAKAAPVGRDGKGRRVDRLQFALIVRTAGKSEHFRRIIQMVVNEQTDAQFAKVRSEKAGRWSYQELRDTRLPEWCRIAWGDIGEHFVLTVGQDVWSRIAAVAAGDAPALANDSWLRAARKQSGRRPLLEMHVAADAFRERLDPLVDGRVSGFLRAWSPEPVDRMHWAMGFEGRALFCLAHLRTGEQTRPRLYADPKTRDARLLATIPETARYAIYRLKLATFIPRMCASILATREPDVRRAVEYNWNKLQVDHGFNARRDFLDHLGGTIVLHNDPPHPLRVPGAMTVLLEIREKPGAVRKTVDTVCAAWQAALEEGADESGKDSPLRIDRGGDGLWYLRFGPIAGPAWTVTERFIILSWSPTALRSYLDKVGDKVGAR